ncbi:hypothetical protein EV122DRAFT_258922 [Schizophyllum commune]
MIWLAMALLAQAVTSSRGRRKMYAHIPTLRAITTVPPRKQTRPEGDSPILTRVLTTCRLRLCLPRMEATIRPPYPATVHLSSTI